MDRYDQGLRCPNILDIYGFSYNSIETVRGDRTFPSLLVTGENKNILFALMNNRYTEKKTNMQMNCVPS